MTSLQTRGSTDVSVVLHVNGRQRLLQLDSRVTLLDALREYLDLVSRKKGCSQGCSRVEILSKEVRESHALQGFR
jgi:aerobic-type carbon monoxide dehydrogenase small subunit (CoxS/CutS family)